MISAAQHNLSNIPASRPFLKTLAEYLLRTTQDSPESLTQYRLLLPTRRACRIMRETFLRLNNGKPMLLPQMSALGDVDEDDLSLMMFGKAGGFLDIPEAITPMRRQLLLARLISTAPDFVQGPDHALVLARALCGLIDQVIVEGVDLADLHNLVPDEFAAHWQITLDFLKIISTYWPEILKENNVVEVSQRRNMLLQSLANHWRDNPPDYPVIAAGSTGSIPAAADVLGVVSRMSKGRVILPGLDVHMDDDAWEQVSDSHPQNSLKTLLSRIGAQKEDVQSLLTVPQDKTHMRESLASAVMLPPKSTHHWKTFFAQHNAKLMTQGLEYYACKTQEEEAQIISMMMRESLEEKTSITALVTPDRGLARRVSAQCRRWGIEVDDSAGQNLSETRLGKFMMLCVMAAKPGFDVIAVLGLMKMSLCRFGYADDVYNRALLSFETDILHTGEIIHSVESLRNIIEKEDGCGAVLDFVDAFYAALKPLLYMARQTEEQKFSDVLKAHIQAVESLAQTVDMAGEEVLWRGDVGDAASLFLSDLMAHADLIAPVSVEAYEKIMENLMHSVSVRSAYGVHPRLLILGQLEARLSDADLVIIGGLNEGVWPPDPGHDPWMSRQMRAEFGLPGKDQAIGLAAHDFVQSFCAPRTVMTRAQKVDGSPTVPSRWLERLEAVLQAGGSGLSELSLRPYREWARQLDAREVVLPYERPAPKPPVSVRPCAVSVTKVDTWRKDPYAIYMHYVLKLRKQEPLRQESDAKLRGTLLHSILDRFIRANPVLLPEDAEEVFLQIAKDVMHENVEDAERLQYWWPKIVNIAAWFVAHEKGWREDAKFLASEIKGSVELDIDGAPFKLNGIADRIDRVSGGYAVIDYKTGSKSFSKIGIKEANFSQLPLESLILSKGGFVKEGNHEPGHTQRIPAGDAQYMGYWKLTGGRVSGSIDAVKGDLSATVERALEILSELVSLFRQSDTPYYCIPDPSKAPDFNDYEHVSRLKEWAALDDAQEGDAA